MSHSPLHHVDLICFHLPDRYGEELAKIMKQTILVGQVASLAQDIEFSKLNLSEITHINTSIIDSEEGESLGEASTKAGILGGIDMSSRRAEINELLGEWEVCACVCVCVCIVCVCVCVCAPKVHILFSSFGDPFTCTPCFSHRNLRKPHLEL